MHIAKDSTNGQTICPEDSVTVAYTTRVMHWVPELQTGRNTNDMTISTTTTIYRKSVIYIRKPDKLVTE
jgi:hypothetical protein